MKNLGAFFIMSFFCVQVIFGQLKMEPKYPTPGEAITLTYHPEDTPLAESDRVKIIIYAFEDQEEPIAVEVACRRSDSGFEATYQTNKNTKLISAIVRDASDKEIVDNNDKQGYQQLMYEGEEPIKRSLMQKASLKASWAGMIGLDRDSEQGVSLMEKESKANGPLNLKDKMTYVRLLSRVDEERGKHVAKSTASKLSLIQKPSEDDLIAIKECYEIIKDEESAQMASDRIKNKYPGGQYDNESKIDQYFDSKDWSEKIKLFHEINPKRISERRQNAYQFMAGDIASHYANESNMELFDKYIKKIDDKMSLARTLNRVAWKMSGESIEAMPANASKGLTLSEQSLKLLEEYYADDSNKPSYYILSDWKKNMEYSKGQYSDTYALLAHHTGLKEEALKYQQISCELSNFDDPEMNERYTVFYEDVKGARAVGEVLEGLIRQGKASEKMKAQFERVFKEDYSMDDAYNKYMAELEKDSKQKLKEELMEQLIDMESPGFVLRNLNGKEVSLNSMKGKVVVLDFWATWCGPCIKSFPGMQQAVNKYAEDPEVEFLFVDTWESDENKEENAKKFMSDNNYNFHVLMDNDNKAVSAYKVPGIPTKFIIDKNQRIRFKSVGFSGSEEKLVNELSLMIDYLKSDGNKKIKVSMN